MCCMDLELICRAGMAILRETDRSRGGVGQCCVPAGDGVWRPPSLGVELVIYSSFPSCSIPQSSAFKIRKCFFWISKARQHFELFLPLKKPLKLFFFLLATQAGSFYKSRALCTFMHLLIHSCLMFFAMHSAEGQFSVHCLDSAELQWPCIRKYSVCSIQLAVC